jgi:hypothetical protein
VDELRGRASVCSTVNAQTSTQTRIPVAATLEWAVIAADSTEASLLRRPVMMSDEEQALIGRLVRQATGMLGDHFERRQKYVKAIHWVPSPRFEFPNV